jgi:hypothetical protein
MGTEPCNLRLLKDKVLRLLQFPNSEGMEPEILLEESPIR